MVAISKVAGPLVNSSYTSQWLIDKLIEKDEGFRNRTKSSYIQKITSRDIGDGNGMMSLLYRLSIHFDDGAKPHSVILKLPQPESVKKVLNSLKTSEANEKNESVDVSSMHEREVQFYDRFANTDDLPMPKIFAAETRVENKRDGTILMEDLSENAAICYFLKSLNVKQILSGIKIVSRLAAMSLSRLTQSEIQQHYTNSASLETYMTVQKSAAHKAVSAHPELFANLISKLENIIQSLEYQKYVASGINQELGIPAVLVHNDLHNYNIFWKKNPDGSCSDEVYAIIDFQTIFAGTIGHDLSGLMVLTLDGKLRRQCEVWLFDYFHAILKAELQSKGLKMPYTIEQIRASYRRSFIRNALFLLICGPVFVLKHGTRKEDDEACCTRLKYALEDAVKILEEDLPQFL